MSGAAGENQLLLEMPSLADNVGVARVAVAAFASQLAFTLPEVEELKVAISEATTNCVLHAYPDAPGLMRVEVVQEDGGVTVRVQDWGVGIADVDQARQAAFSSSADPEHLGLGFTFMENFTDHVDVWSQPGEGTLITMRKRPQAAPVAAGGEAQQA